MAIQRDPSFSLQSQKKTYYDLKEIENIPILDVCSHFGISVISRGQEYWCKLREEKTPSTVLHTGNQGRFQINTFHDFGSNEGGNTITLTCKILGLNPREKEDRSKAINYLADAFCIAPLANCPYSAGTLSNAQYEKIGLYGDLATKNFDFSQSNVDQMREISSKYGMPMNQLKRVYPRTFEHLLRRIAIPFIEQQRNCFYMDIWLCREAVRLAEASNSLVFQNRDFSKDAAYMQELDQILDRAMIGTRLDPFSSREYDPEAILQKIDTGLLKPKFGNKSYKQMMHLANRRKTTVKYKPLDVFAVYFEGSELFGEIPYSAFLDAGIARVGYLETDTEKLQSIFDRLAKKGTETLEHKVTEAKQRCVCNQVPGVMGVPVPVQQR